MTQNMKCTVELLQKRFDPKTQKLITSTSSTTYRHWPYTMMPTLSIISKVVNQEIAHLPVELCIMVMILILNRNHVIYPGNYGNMIRIHIITYREKIFNHIRIKSFKVGVLCYHVLLNETKSFHLSCLKSISPLEILLIALIFLNLHVWSIVIMEDQLPYSTSILLPWPSSWSTSFIFASSWETPWGAPIGWSSTKYGSTTTSTNSTGSSKL